MGRVRAYLACSLDGYIADPDHDLGWLNREHGQPGDLGKDPEYLEFAAFMGEVGALLMGRRTYDTVEGFGGWHYGETPVLVATHRPLKPVVPTVAAVKGSLPELLSMAHAAADGRDIYLDGGELVQQALNMGLLDEVTVTWIPVILGAGVRLFDDLQDSHRVQFTRRAADGNGLVQMTAVLR
ncbi:MAG: dihydrofolate reductase [Myxococcales bacterium]|nr:dihydrofolate reductase [Myxococcales bacterium]MCB9525933.1 dihydrofolate reductase [Myxococcales bacterium]